MTLQSSTAGRPEKTRLIISLLALATFGVLCSVLPLAYAWQDLPDPLATHWGLGGAPDAATTRVTFLGVLVLGACVPAALSWPRRPAAVAAAPGLIAVVAFTSALMVAISVSTISLNWGRADWRAAGHFSFDSLVLLLLLPAAFAGLALLVARRFFPPAAASSAADAATLPLASDEKAFWTGSAKNPWFIVLGVALLAEGWVLGLVISRAAPGGVNVMLAIHLLVIAALAFVVRIRVTINERALIIRYGYLGWPRQRFSLERIRSAAAFDLIPMEHGGWGYRGSLHLLGRAALVVRGGLALRLELEGGKRFSITVDDAETAARLINAFVARRAQPAMAG